MSAPAAHFQLFPPPPPPPKASRDSNNPFRRTGPKGLSVISTAATSIYEDDVYVSPSSNKSPGEAILVQIYKEESPIQQAAKTEATSSRAVTPLQEYKDDTTASPKRSGTPLKRSPPSPLQIIKTKSPPLPPRESANDASGSNDDDKSPVVAMRSMFPCYNPSLPLDRQEYYPLRAASPQNLPGRSVSRAEYSPTRPDVSKIDELVGGPKTAPASVIDFPLDSMEVKSPPISTLQDLEVLWDATSGLGPDGVTDSYNMALSRLEEAKFAFGASPYNPFYTLDTYSNNELIISRKHPSKPNRNFEILQLDLRPPRQKAPSINSSSNLLETRGREMITYIFPKLAAMVALEQAEKLSDEHQLAPTMKLQTRQEALARAAAQEASRLYWNERDRRYELEHPAIGKDQPRSAGLEITTTSESPKPSIQPVLHILISCPETSSPSSTSLPTDLNTLLPYTTITIIDPSAATLNSVNAISHDPPSSPPPPRASTLPIPDTSDYTLPTALASLTFHPKSPILNIDAPAILSLLPSLYAIDSLVSALLAVAVADTITNNLMAELPLYDPLRDYKLNLPPQPTVPRPGYASSVVSDSARTIGGRSYAGSTFYATVAEREDAEREERASQRGGSRRKNKSKDGNSPFGLTSIRSFAAMTALNEDPEKDARDPNCDSDIDSPSDTPPATHNKRTWFGRRKAPRHKTKKIVLQEFDLEKYGTYQSGSREGQKLPGATRAMLRVMFTILQFVVWILTVFVEVIAKAVVGVTRGVTSERF